MTVAPTSLKLLEYFDEWLAHRSLKPGTRKGYQRAVLQDMKNLHHRKVTSITTDDVRGLITRWREEGKSGGTIRTFLAPLSAMYSTLESDGKVDHNPVKQLERGTTPKTGKRKKIILTPKEAQELFSGVESLSFKVYNALALFAGLRQSEALGLQWGGCALRWLRRARRAAPPRLAPAHA